MKIYSDRLDKFSVICSVCGGDHNVIIIPLKDGSRRVISPPLPEQNDLATLGLKLTSMGGAGLVGLASPSDNSSLTKGLTLGTTILEYPLFQVSSKLRSRVYTGKGISNTHPPKRNIGSGLIKASTAVGS